MKAVRPLKLALLSTVLVLAVQKPSLAFERAFPVWKKELFREKEGGFFVEFTFDGFLSPSMQNLAPEHVTVRVRNLLTSEVFTWTQESRGTAILRASAGKYEPLSVSLVDGAGRPRQWSPRSGASKPFIVTRQSLSNLGTWTLSPEGAAALRLRYADSPPSLTLGPEERKAIHSIINGFKGLVQQRLAGDAAGTAGDVRIRGDHLELSVRTTREISLQRKVAVRGAPAMTVANVLRDSDPNVRECYKKRLAQDPQARGIMEMAFVISRETGTIRKLTLTGGDFKEQEFVQCVFDELTPLRFDVPGSAIGKITYEFDVKL